MFLSVRKRGLRLRARLLADDASAHFVCSLDRGRFHPCPATVTTGALSVGRHVLRAAAVDAAGNQDPTPAIVRFRIGPQRLGVSFLGPHTVSAIRRNGVRLALSCRLPARLHVTVALAAGRSIGSRTVMCHGGTRRIHLRIAAHVLAELAALNRPVLRVRSNSTSRFKGDRSRSYVVRR
jgi:hypothetical protein